MIAGNPPSLIIPTSNKVMILPAHNSKKHVASYIYVKLPHISAFDVYYGDSDQPYLVAGDGKVSNQIVVISVNCKYMIHFYIIASSLFLLWAFFNSSHFWNFPVIQINIYDKNQPE